MTALKEENSGKCVFVTVGSFGFDSLIYEVLSKEVIKTLARQGYVRLVIQFGNGNEERIKERVNNARGIMDVDYYHYKDKLLNDMKRADLIISHAGAGSILESLNLGKRLLVVVNEGLAENHQVELARQLATMQHLAYATCSTLHKTLQDQAMLQSFQPFPPANTALFANFLDERVGYAIET